MSLDKSGYHIDTFARRYGTGVLPFPNVLSMDLPKLGPSVSDCRVVGHSWAPPVALCISGVCSFLLLSSVPLFSLFTHSPVEGHGGGFQVFGDCE